uniref:ADP-ribosylglycohydrolase n=1 Tax=Zooxanthella nutricula TaxID=1333877 RepID=A0A6U9GXS7_9DINO
MGATGSAPTPYKPLDDLELLARCSGASRRPGRPEAEAFLRFRAHEAPVLGAGALQQAVEAVQAERFTPWPIAPADCGLPSAQVADRVRGALLGAAAADACGLATEFLSRAKAEEFYGLGFDYRPGCALYPDSHRAFFPQGDWTDDTDQLLLVLQSLLACGGLPDQQDFARRLKQWARHGFQQLGDRCGSGLGKTVGKVVDAKGFEEAPVECAERIWRNNGCNLAANGAVMRAALCGVPMFWDLDCSERAAVAFCQVTHFDTRCVASCVCVSIAISCLLSGWTCEKAVAEGVERAANHLDAEHMDDFKWYTSVDRTLDQLNLDEPHSIGYTFKALACGLHALRSDATFAEAIHEVVARGGDADTNAVVCGALLGCARGAGAVPAAWVDAMPYKGWLEAWATQALHASGCANPPA